MNPHLFREYDIRGIVGPDLNEDVVETIGRAFGTRCVREQHKRIAVGHDVRLSSLGFSEALCRGIASTGTDVVYVGMLPTPLLYFAVIDGPLDGGVMITGSHNPRDYNGLKFCAGGLSLYGDEIQELQTLCEAGEFAEGRGSIEERSIEPLYLADVAMRFSQQTPRKIVIDCGNGVGGLIAPGLERTSPRHRAATALRRSNKHYHLQSTANNRHDRIVDAAVTNSARRSSTPTEQVGGSFRSHHSRVDNYATIKRRLKLLVLGCLCNHDQLSLALIPVRQIHLAIDRHADNKIAVTTITTKLTARSSDHR